MYNHLDLRIVFLVSLTSPSCLHRVRIPLSDSAALHRHSSTVAQNGQNHTLAVARSFCFFILPQYEKNTGSTSNWPCDCQTKQTKHRTLCECTQLFSVTPRLNTQQKRTAYVALSQFRCCPSGAKKEVR